MKAKIGVLLGVCGVGLLLASAGTSEAGPNPCLTQAANATLTLGANAVESTSPDTSYANSACRGYVVDIRANGIPGGAQVLMDGSAANGNNTDLQCQLENEHVEFYRKAAGATDWTVQGGGFRHGHWTGSNFPTNTCLTETMSGFQNRSGAVVNGDTWRVVVRAVDDSTPVRTKVTASAFIPPG